MTGYIRRVTQLRHPLPAQLESLDMELTERCNNACLHCCINRPANDLEAKARELTTAQVQAILQQAADLGCLRVRFTGGEPLLRPDFEAVYVFARRLGMRVLLFTNARLVIPSLADLFARIPPKEIIEISVYGMRPASYEAAAGAQGAFEQFWRGVNLLLERKIPFVVKGAYLPPNRAELDEFEAWAQTLPWMREPPSYSMNFDLRHRRDDAAKNAQVAALRLSPQETVALLRRDERRYRRRQNEFASKFMGHRGDKLFTCGAGSGHSACVDAYGRAQPCLSLRTPELTSNLLDPATNGTGLRLALEQFARLGERRATNPDYLRRCAACGLKGFCEQCPAKSWAEHGTLDTPVEYFCAVAHAQARYLGWLGENEHGWEVGPEGWRERLRPETAPPDFPEAIQKEP